ncbi:hypothetical protein ECFRIK2001_5524, partial [Escherichia coli FRIK2001]
MVFAPVNAPFS